MLTASGVYPCCLFIVYHNFLYVVNTKIRPGIISETDFFYLRSLLSALKLNTRLCHAGNQIAFLLRPFVHTDEFSGIFRHFLDPDLRNRRTERKEARITVRREPVGVDFSVHQIINPFLYIIYSKINEYNA